MNRGERGFALTVVLLGFLIVELIGAGILAVVTSDLHGAVANRLAMESVQVAEAGVNYAAAQLVSRAALPAPTDDAYAGDGRDLPLTGRDGTTIGTFRVTVTCVFPAAAAPPNCRDDPATPGIQAQDLRRIIAVGFVPDRPGRARRQIETIVRRLVPRSGAPAYGVCGRDGVEIARGSTVTADVGSNSDIRVDRESTIRRWNPLPPSAAPAAEPVAPIPPAAGLTGVYSWRLTFIDAQGQESSGGPPATMELRDQIGRLTDLPVGDSSVVTRRLYRTRADRAAAGPWFLVAELPSDSARTYVDGRSDDGLGLRIPGPITGAAYAAGTVACDGECGSRIDGPIASLAHDVVCPNFLPPPCRPGIDPAPPTMVQSATTQELRWGALRVAAGGLASVQTLSRPTSQLDIHVTDLVLEPGASLIITGPGTVTFHVSGSVHLGEGAVLGPEGEETPRPSQVRRGDQVGILSCARDPGYDPADPVTAAVRLDGGARVSAHIFAPQAGIVIAGAAVTGSLFGKRVHVYGSTSLVLDPTAGLTSETWGIRPTPYQYLLRWYDSPTVSP